jgi:predicted ATPase
MHQACVTYQLCADVGRLKSLATELIELTANQGFAHWHATGTIFHGWCIAACGEREAGIAQMREGLAAKQATGARLKVPYYLGLIAAFLGETSKGDSMLLIADALDRVERTGERWFEAELHRLKGEVLAAGSEPEFPEAEAEIQQALNVARAQGARLWELRAATSLACAWRHQHRREDARHLLAPIYVSFSEGHNLPDMKKARALLETLT